MPKERIQKLMSAWGVCSRRKAEEYIQAGRVKRNGRPVDLGEKADPARDIITLDDKKINPQERQKLMYIMLNKPRGYVTTLSDELGRKCVSDLVSDAGTRLFPVGRLDRNSEGLLLLTNDGELAHKIMHPSFQAVKKYRASIAGKITPEDEIRFIEGIKSGEDILKFKSLEILSESEESSAVIITLVEGKNRHIRRAFEENGMEVSRLKRIYEAGISLGSLPVGKWRHLLPHEVKLLKDIKREEKT